MVKSEAESLPSRSSLSVGESQTVRKGEAGEAGKKHVPSSVTYTTCTYTWGFGGWAQVSGTYVVKRREVKIKLE